MVGNNRINVTVQTQYLKEHSEPSENHFAFGYTITISNLGQQAARLLRRHWIITDANGNIQEVYGDGVVGEQPLIQPGQSYQYSSGAVLPTPIGSMQGNYTMVSQSGDYFDAIIQPFRLANPELVN